MPEEALQENLKKFNVRKYFYMDMEGGTAWGE